MSFLPWTSAGRFSPVFGPGSELVKSAGKLDRAVNDDLLTEWDTEFWHVKPLSAALASCLITATMGQVATLVRSILGRS